MDKIFILGATKYSFMIREFILQEQQYEVIGYTVNKQYMGGSLALCEKMGAKLFPFEELNQYVDSSEKVFVLNTLGYTNMNKTRQKLHNECIMLDYVPISFISKRAIVLSDMIGSGNIIFPGAYIGTNVIIGDCNVFYAGCVITHDITIGNNNFIAANVTIGGETHISNNCFLGMGATVRNRVSLSDYSLIGANAYLSHSTNDCEVVVPARSVTLEKNSFELDLTPRV